VAVAGWLLLITVAVAVFARGGVDYADRDPEGAGLWGRGSVDSLLVARPELVVPAAASPVVVPAPTPQPVAPAIPIPVAAVVVSGAPAPPRFPSTAEAFLAGYRAAAGPPEWGSHFVEVVVPCECPSWDCGEGRHYGLLQFDPGTWAKCRRSPDADPLDPFEQGWCAATWLNMGVDPVGTGGWANCW